jgi:trans-aconitate 2-methyltransferase
VSGDVWRPEQYERFRAEREQPGLDLIALVRPVPGGRVVDLGCGAGELTARLHRQARARETLGIDSSPAMLGRAARALAGEGLGFQRETIEAFLEREQRWDVVFSNAALHWVADHEALVPRLAAAIAPEGQLAVQMPANEDHPSHAVAAEVAGEARFADALRGFARRPPLLAPERYAALLARLGFRDMNVRLQVYAHWLASRDEVVEWVKGTLLTEYERRLPAELFAAFLARYRERLLPRLADERPFFYPFKRILLWARRGG